MKKLRHCHPMYFDMEPRLNTRFLGPFQVNIPNGITIDSAVFAGLTVTVVTDACPRCSVCNNGLHLTSVAMWPNNTGIYGTVFDTLILDEWLLDEWLLSQANKHCAGLHPCLQARVLCLRCRPNCQDRRMNRMQRFTCPL